MQIRTTGSTTLNKIPDKLVGPSSNIPVKVEVIYTQALLDTEVQVTLLYGDFYKQTYKALTSIDAERA